MNIKLIVCFIMVYVILITISHVLGWRKTKKVENFTSVNNILKGMLKDPKKTSKMFKNIQLDTSIVGFNSQKVYILGAMKELGVQTDFFHLQIIELVTKLNLKRIIFIGEEFYKFKKKFNKFVFYKNYKPVINYLNKEINNVKNIFVMGSRSNKLDRIIKQYVK